MASVGGGAGSKAQSNYNPNVNYTVPLTLMVTLFFMIGFITVLNDVLIPTMKEIFHFGPDDNLKLMLIQFSFFIAYGVMSIPAGMIIEKLGYKKTLSIALGVIATGLLLFVPAAETASYPFFLVALFIVANGLAILQVAINPYLIALGSPETGAARLTFGGTLNSTATAVGPIIGAWLILDECVKGADRIHLVKGPYIGLALIIMSIAGVLFFLKLPKIESIESEDKAHSGHSIMEYPHLLLGALAIFFYVGAEVAIGSFLVVYLKDDFQIAEKHASALVAYYWSSAMIGRAIGSLVTAKINPAKALAFVSGVALLLVVLSMTGIMMSIGVTIPVLEVGNDCTTGNFFIGFIPVEVPLGAFLLVLVGLFNAIMWPVIFPLGIKNLGPLTSKGSGLMVTMVIGGAFIPLIQGALADAIGYQYSFALVLICYGYILYYALVGHKPKGPGAEEDAFDTV